MSASYVLEMFDVTRENHILLPLVTKLHLELSVNNVMNCDGGSVRCVHLMTSPAFVLDIH